MEVRKIQTTASGSFFITLPKAWVTELKIKKGEDIGISKDEENMALRLTPIKQHEQYYNEFIIQIEDYPKESSLERSINSSYIQGSDVIIISSENTITMEKKTTIKKATSNLIGTEISEEFSNKITIRILVDPVKFPLADLINRIYRLVASMHVDSIKSFMKNDEVLATDIIHREEEVDKLFYLMLRQLNLSLSGRLDFSEICESELKIDCVLGILLARDLSKMAHYAFEIAHEVIKLKDKKIPEELKENVSKVSKFVIKMQQNAILAFFKNDFMRANNVLDSIHELIDFYQKTKNEVLENITDINTIVNLIAILRNLRNIASSAVEASQDLQAKHRPKTTTKRQKEPGRPIDQLILLNPGYEIKD